MFSDVLAAEGLGPRLARLLDRLAAEAPRDGFAERQAQRHAVQVPVWLGVFTQRFDHVAGPAMPAASPNLEDASDAFRPIYRAWAMDLSPHGISLVTEQDLPPQTRWSVSLEALTQEPLYVPMRVVYCKQLLSHTYRVGGAFLVDRSEACGGRDAR